MLSSACVQASGQLEGDALPREMLQVHTYLDCLGGWDPVQFCEIQKYHQSTRKAHAEVLPQHHEIQKDYQSTRKRMLKYCRSTMRLRRTTNVLGKGMLMRSRTSQCAQHSGPPIHWPPQGMLRLQLPALVHELSKCWFADLHVGMPVTTQASHRACLPLINSIGRSSLSAACPETPETHANTSMLPYAALQALVQAMLHAAV